MNIFYFASSYRSYTSLLNIYKESVNRNINSLFLYSEEAQVQNISDMSKYNFSSNLDEVNFADKNGYYAQCLNVYLPFKPDVVILARERWMPEQAIIQEFKGRWLSKVYVVEVSSHLTNNIENRLEMISRECLCPKLDGYPQKFVDVYFEHSEFAKQRRIECLYPEWSSKSIVVGNPRYDELTQVTSKEYCVEKYKIDKDKKQILFWGVINTTRKKVLESLQKLQDKYGEDYQIFYKPNPQEPYNEIFKHQFNPFCVDGVEIIEENDINTMSELCDIHIGAVTSILNYAFYYNKKIVNLNSICNVEKYMNDFNRYYNETKDGVEDSAQFWMNVFGCKTIEEFINLIDFDIIEKFKPMNDEVESISKKSINDFDLENNFLENLKPTSPELIKLFDEFNDKKASHRIINYIEENK